MAKRRNEEPPPSSSRMTLLFLAIGGIAVAGLVVWALTRTVETSIPGYTSTTATPAASSPVAPSTTSPVSNPLTATASYPQAPAAPEENPASVPRISVEDLREKLRANAITLIDVRDDASFATSHIPGALHIPFARVQGEMSTIPKNKPIVTYCT